jgi:hypothetical protein
MDVWYQRGCKDSSYKDREDVHFCSGNLDAPIHEKSIQQTKGVEDMIAVVGDDDDDDDDTLAGSCHDGAGSDEDEEGEAGVVPSVCLLSSICGSGVGQTGCDKNFVVKFLTMMMMMTTTLMVQPLASFLQRPRMAVHDAEDDVADKDGDRDAEPDLLHEQFHRTRSLP